MPKLAPILKKAYYYTKDHKQLWFFGFFLTIGSMFSILKLVDVDFSGFPINFSPFLETWSRHHIGYTLSVIVAIPVLALLFLISGYAKSVVLSTVIKFERKEHSNREQIMKEAKKFALPIATINLLVNIIQFIIFIWVFLPTAYVFNQGYILRGVLLLFVGVSIFVPIFVIGVLVSTFAQYFVLAFKLGLNKSFRAAFDLYFDYWPAALGLLMFLFLAYVLAFFVSASIVGAIAGLAYFLTILVKSLSVSLFWVLQSLIIIFFGLILIFINAVLNVFTAVSWTLFFLEIVKGEPFEGKEKPRVAAPANVI